MRSVHQGFGCCCRAHRDAQVTHEQEQWEIEEGVRCVVCPGCAFTFDAYHVTAATGEYDCPACGYSSAAAAAVRVPLEEQR